MRRERERVQWERETEQDVPVGPLHYQSVQEGEVRNHGVSYYQFSDQEEERKKQMEMLDKLRDEVGRTLCVCVWFVCLFVLVCYVCVCVCVTGVPVECNGTVYS